MMQVVLSCPAFSVPIMPSRVFTLPVFVWYTGGFSSISRNFSNSLIHCDRRSVLASNTRVLILLFAIMYAASTVFPKAVGAQSTPFSNCSNLAAAKSCCSRSSPLKRTRIGLPWLLLSKTSQVIPLSDAFD